MLERDSKETFEGRATTWKLSGEFSGKAFAASGEAPRKISPPCRGLAGRPPFAYPGSSEVPCRASMGFLNFLTGRSLSPYSGTTIKNRYLSSCFRGISPARSRKAWGSPLVLPERGERLCSASASSLNVLPRRSLSPHSSTAIERWHLSSSFSPGNSRGAHGRFENGQISIYQSCGGPRPVIAAL